MKLFTTCLWFPVQLEHCFQLRRVCLTKNGIPDERFSTELRNPLVMPICDLCAAIKDTRLVVLVRPEVIARILEAPTLSLKTNKDGLVELQLCVDCVHAVKTENECENRNSKILGVDPKS